MIKGIVFFVLVLLSMPVVSANLTAGIEHDSNILKMMIGCNHIFNHPDYKDIVLSADNKRFDTVYTTYQRDINSRYSKEDSNRLWGDAMYFVSEEIVGKRPTAKQFNSCRRWTDEAFNFLRSR